MIKDYKTYNKSISKIPIIGLPSGECLEITIDQFNALNDFEMIVYDNHYRAFMYQDDDYDNIKFLVDNTKK